MASKLRLSITVVAPERGAASSSIRFVRLGPYPPYVLVEVVTVPPQYYFGRRGTVRAANLTAESTSISTLVLSQYTGSMPNTQFGVTTYR